MNIILLAKSASRLFTLPEICLKIQELIYDPSSSAEDIAKLISIDPSLSARLLKIANSSFYNFSSQIDSLGRAVNIIGTEDLFNLALATSTPSTFSKLNNNDNIDIGTYWRHSVMTGLIGRSLTKECSLRRSESLFLAGLFHNLGQLVVLEQLPELFIKIEELKNATDAPWKIEKDVLGYTYGAVSAELLKCWKMPLNIIELVQTQHDPVLSSDPLSAALLHIASRTASQLEYNKLFGFDFNETIYPAAWAVTRLSEENLNSAVESAELNCHAMLTAMTGKQMQAA